MTSVLATLAKPASLRRMGRLALLASLAGLGARNAPAAGAADADADADGATPVACEIRSTTPMPTRHVGDPLGVEVRVCNASGAPLRLVECVEHSEIGARLPRTSFLVSGPALVQSDLLATGCPRIPGIRRDDVVRLAPGACVDPFARRPSVTLASARLPEPGRYTVRFEYATRRQGQELVSDDTPAARRALKDVPLVDVECSIELEVIARE